MSSLVKLYGTKCPPMSKMAWDQLSMGSIVLQSFQHPLLLLHNQFDTEVTYPSSYSTS